ncbi:hypothetical protein [Streptomyces sp. NPDC004728]|uniref:hypothetical protein n=1 Tax=Streptomyces sp. NPDC004728 TaxID=3154289 RepID=UPI0033B80422
MGLRTAAALMAAWLEAGLGRPNEARERARKVLEIHGAGEPDETGEERRAEAEALLEYVGRRTGAWKKAAPAALRAGPATPPR